jgi:hypothetical protein
VFRYVSLLLGEKRVVDAIPVAEQAASADPDNQQLRDLLQSLKRFAGKN